MSSMLDSGELNAASKIIYGIVEAQNFEALDVEQKVDLLAIKGDILVKKGKKADARKVADKLLKYDVQTKRKADFLHFYSAVYQNKKIFDIAL
ncbi:MAG: hypothetical protein GWN01_04330, partial [Nitrosopumilaceae archaeon]|nr:hypothetical protein [Nitrosopumilaceae archaeon]NIX60781.1 hypothetical protein [Nitrosopumilaceae archaeon]